MTQLQRVGWSLVVVSVVSTGAATFGLCWLAREIVQLNAGLGSVEVCLEGLGVQTELLHGQVYDAELELAEHEARMEDRKRIWWSIVPKRYKQEIGAAILLSPSREKPFEFDLVREGW